MASIGGLCAKPTGVSIVYHVPVMLETMWQMANLHCFKQTHNVVTALFVPFAVYI